MELSTSPDEAAGEAGPKLSGAVYSSPYGNELLEALAEEAIRQEKLGQRDATDLLTISFSSNDAVGHALGPDAPQVHDICVRTDRVLAKPFKFIDETVGMDHVVVALTADHGVMPLPEHLAQDKMPGGRLSGADLFGEISERSRSATDPATGFSARQACRRI